MHGSDCRQVSGVPLPMKTLNHTRRLRQAGLSYAEIGRKLKISKASAFNACKRETKKL